MLQNSTNKLYRQNKADWELAKAFYSTDNPEKYLDQGKYESDGAFLDRRRSAHTFPYSRQIIHRISDQLLLRADEVERDIGPLPESYLSSAGPEAESHNLQLKTLGDYLLLYGEAWLQVRPTRSTPQLIVLSPLSVPRWNENKVITLGERTVPTPIEEKEKVITSYTVHSPRGYETYVYQKNDVGKREKTLVESGSYSPDDEDMFFVDERGNPTPPLVHVQMPWETVLGVEVAQTHLQMFRLENQIDQRLRTSLTSGQLVYNGVNDDGEQRIINAHKKGKNLIFLPDNADVKPMNVPTDAVAMGEERLANKEETLYETAYNTLRANTSNSSATETVVRQQSTSAALATLASTVESGEESALRLLAQSENIFDFGGGSTPPQDPEVSSNWTDIDWAESGVSLNGEE